MEDLIYYNNLYDIYGELLTDTQRKYFEDYYFNNLSYSEMSLNYGVSRNAIFKQLRQVIEKLELYDEKLKLLDKKNKMLDIIERVSDLELKKDLNELI